MLPPKMEILRCLSFTRYRKAPCAGLPFFYARNTASVLGEIGGGVGVELALRAFIRAPVVPNKGAR